MRKFIAYKLAGIHWNAFFKLGMHSIFNAPVMGKRFWLCKIKFCLF